MEMKDRQSDLLLEVLKQALASPGEHRLFRAGKLVGLFPGRTGPSVQAAERALREELLRRTRTEVRGKSEIEWVEITPQGVDFLHRHESPTQALHDLRAALRSNQQSLPVWLAEMTRHLRDLEARLTTEAAQWRVRLESMEQRLNDTLRRLESASPLVPPEVLAGHPWAMDALNYLDRRRAGGGVGGCPLPELFAAVKPLHGDLSLASFHDGLRRLHQRRAIELRPVDDPTSMRQPEFAMLDGDAVYYLALR